MQKLVVTLLGLVTLCAACGQSEFGGGVTQNPVNPPNDDDGTMAPQPKQPEVSTTPAPDGTRSFFFTGNELGQPVDMVLTVDNSSSMADEAAHVRNNVSDFISSVEGIADLRLALISWKFENFQTTGVTLSDQAIEKGHKQVDIKVESTNLLSMAAAAVCAPEQTNTGLIVPRVCNRNLTDSYNEVIENTDEIKGSLASFLRPAARHIFIFVTDDAPRGVLISDFKAILQPLSPKGLNTFAFRGGIPTQAVCSVTTSGEPYDILASQTNGKTFDICETDWKPYFESITEKIREYNDPGYALPAGVDVLKVKFDGMILEANEYRIENNVLRLASNIRTTKKDKIEVVVKK